MKDCISWERFMEQYPAMRRENFQRAAEQDSQRFTKLLKRVSTERRGRMAAVALRKEDPK